MRAGEKGITLQLLAQKDCTGCTAATFKRRSPSGAADEKSLALPTGSDLTSGIFSYITLAGDFTEAGQWALQLIVGFGASQELKSPIITLPVELSL